MNLTGWSLVKRGLGRPITGTLDGRSLQLRFDQSGKPIKTPLIGPGSFVCKDIPPLGRGDQVLERPLWLRATDDLDAYVATDTRRD